MNTYVKILWNASVTGIVVTLLAGMLVLAMPPSYLATATIQANADNLVLFQSASLLREVMEEAQLEAASLRSWSDALLDRESSVLNLLKQRLTVRGDDSGWIEVSVTAADPDVAAETANAAAMAYLRRNSSVSTSQEDRAVKETEMTAIDKAIVDFKRQHPDLRNPSAFEESLVRRSSQIDERIRILEKDLVSARTELAVLQSGDLAPVSSEPGIRRILVKQQQLISRKAELSSRYGSRHHKMISLEAEIRQSTAQVEEEIDRAENRARVKVNSLSQRLEELDTESQALERQRLDFEQNRVELNELLSRKDALTLQLSGRPSTVDESRLSAAIPPESSLGFGQVQLMLLVFIISFICVAAIQLLRPAAKQ